MGYVRLLLALAVVAVHSAGYPHGRLLDIGLVAVAVFFFISGFNMPLAFERNYAVGTFSKRTQHFLVNRLLRIFPPCLFALFLMLLALMFSHGSALREAKAEPIIFLQNFVLLSLNQVWLWGQDVRFIGPAWTLDVELQYYLLLPFCSASIKGAPSTPPYFFLPLAFPAFS